MKTATTVNKLKKHNLTIVVYNNNCKHNHTRIKSNKYSLHSIY